MAAAAVRRLSDARMKNKDFHMGNDSEMAKKTYKDCSTDGEHLHRNTILEHVKEHSLSDNLIRVDKSSLEFPQLSQEELRAIFGPRPEKMTFVFEDSDGSEDEDRIPVEEYKKTNAVVKKRKKDEEETSQKRAKH